MTFVLSEILKLSRLIALRWGVYMLMVGGLLLAYSTAILIGLFVRDELTYDRFLPDAARTYLVAPNYGPQGQALAASDLTPAGVAHWMRTDLPSVEATTRLVAIDWPMATQRRRVKERFYWADSNVFDVLRLPVRYGDLSTALRDPGSVVMTERMARAYFGQSNAIGETLKGKGNIVYHVTAVLRDLPSNTNLDREIFVAGSGDYAMLAILDHNPDLLWPNT